MSWIVFGLICIFSILENIFAISIPIFIWLALLGPFLYFIIKDLIKDAIKDAFSELENKVDNFENNLKSIIDEIKTTNALLNRIQDKVNPITPGERTEEI